LSDFTKSDYETLAAFRFQLRQFLHFSESKAHAIGLTPRQHQALLAIQGFPGNDRISIGELANQLLIAHHSAVGLVDRLVAQKLVEREPNKDDRRQVFLSLTQKGLRLLRQLSSAHQSELRKLAPLLIELLANIP
jgi:DNA-binding MarR family transcriptional regulator